MFQLMDKKIIAILRSKILLNWPYDLNLYLLLYIVYVLALFQHLCFQKILGITITVTNQLGFLSFVWPDLGPNCLQRLSAEDTSRQRVNCSGSRLDNVFKANLVHETTRIKLQDQAAQIHHQTVLALFS